MGPHPAVAEIRRAVRSALAGPGGNRTGGPIDETPLLVACSGGADSVALAAAVAFVAPRLGLRAGLVTVDHGLAAGSAARARAVAALGFELGLDPVEVMPVRVRGTGGPEANARAARYSALDAVAAALEARVLLGHTLDDQAETVLIGLGRGSGPRSIAGMRPVGPPPVHGGSAEHGPGRYLRPLLGVRRVRTAAACAALGLPVWDDPHNADPRFQRVRVRREVLPLLEDVLHGGVAEALARTATLLQDDLDALDVVTARATGRPSGPDLPDLPDLAAAPTAVRRRLLRKWAATVGAGSLAADHLAALDALVVGWHGQRGVDLPGGVRVGRVSGRLVAVPLDPPAQE